MPARSQHRLSRGTKTEGARARRFSSRRKEPVGAYPRVWPEAPPDPARHLRAHLRAPPRLGRRKTHLLRGGNAGRCTSRAGPFQPFLPDRNKRTKPSKGSGRTRPARRRRGAPPSRTPRLPPAEAASSQVRRVTSRGRKAGGCHGDTWASLPLGRATLSDPASGSAGTIATPREGSRRGCTSPTPTSFHAYCRLQRPLPVARREPRPRSSRAFDRTRRTGRTTIPRMPHDTELHFPEASATRKVSHWMGREFSPPVTGF